MSDEERGPDSGSEGSDSERPKESSQEDVAREREVGRELGWKFKEAEREAEARARQVAAVESKRARDLEAEKAETEAAEDEVEDDEAEDEVEDDEDEADDEEEDDYEDEPEGSDASPSEPPQYTDDMGQPIDRKDVVHHAEEEFLPFEPDTPSMRVITATFVIIAVATVVIFIGTREYFLAGIAQEQQEKIFGLRPVQLEELRANETKKLDHYQWIDKEKGRVRLPVARATDLVLADYKKTPMDEPPAEEPPAPAPPPEPEPEEETEGEDTEGEGGGAAAPDAPGGDAPAPAPVAPGPVPAPPAPAPPAPAPPAPAPPPAAPPAPAPPPAAPPPSDPSGGI